MKRVITLLLLCMALLSSCAGSFKDIRMTSYDIVSITPKGLSSVDAVIDLGIDNPAMGFTLTDIKGVARLNNEPCLLISADDMKIEGRSEKEYRLLVHGVLGENFNPFQLLTLLKNTDLSQIKVDASARAELGYGIGKTIEIKDKGLDKLLKDGLSL